MIVNDQERRMAGKSTDVEREPTITDLIVDAQKLENEAQLVLEEVRDAERRHRLAKEASRSAWDAIYDQLAQIKQFNRESESFRSSKLGKLLENIR